MLVHHFEQVLDIFIFLFCGHFLVRLKLGHLLVPHIHYDLLRLLHFEDLSGSALVDRVTFNALILNLRGVDHLGSRKVRLLIEGVLYEFLLEPKVLELLLLLALALHVRRVVEDAQLFNLLLLLVLHRDIAKDYVSLCQLILLTIAFSTQELFSFALFALKTIIALEESLLVLLAMILN